jgi:ATP-dependent Lon protease
VVFDEVAGLAIHDVYGTTSIMKDYMESGRYSRGNREYSADASLVLLGNLTTEGGQPAPYYTHFFRDLPPMLLDTAVIDRLHMFIPGWEIPKLTPDALEPEWGLSMDAIGSIMAELRVHAMDAEIAGIVARHPYRPAVTQRDRRALDKVVGGLLKLLYPHKVPAGSELQALLGFAGELRQRVHNQLSQIASGEFGDRIIGFEGIEPHRPADFTRGVVWTTHDRRLNVDPRPGEITALMTRLDQNGEPIDGDIQVVEASVVTGPGGLQMTGFRGKAMEQSAQAAFHYIREHLTDFRLSPDALQGTTLAVHLVSIERRRDGPSAGLAFLLAMVSALTGRPVLPALAVTGEVTLHGEIEPVGGLSAKLYAALRHGRTHALVPEANRGELEDIRRDFHDVLEIRMVATVAEALREAFGLTPLPGRGQT